jgi:putative endonuclease
MPGARGDAGEKAAARELRRQGMVLLERNVRVAGAEIDLVALDRETVVFVEVKARSGESFGAPAEAVDRRKQARISRASRAFLASSGLAGRPVRYDVASVTLDASGRPQRVRWIRAAFASEDGR